MMHVNHLFDLCQSGKNFVLGFYNAIPLVNQLFPIFSNGIALCEIDLATLSKLLI
jgi:hypothetical protein